MSATQAAVLVARSKWTRSLLATAALLVVSAPILVAAGVVGVFAQEAESACRAAGGVAETPAGGSLAAGLYAEPLQLAPGRWYAVGATEYGGPSDPTSGDYGSIPDPAQSYLPAHPDSFAELSVLERNPANSGAFTFADANALDNLSYLTGLRVRHDRLGGRHGRERCSPGT